MQKLLFLSQHKLMGRKVSKIIFFFSLILFFTGSAYAQKTVSSTYTFTTGTGTYGGDLGLSYTTVIGANQDNATSGLRNLPFTFNYLGQDYTQWSVTSNGLITLGGTALTGNETSNSMAASIPGIKIAPYWDDLATGTNGYVKYAYYYGTMYINFRLTAPKSAGAANAEFQVRLTASGGISFYYGSTASWPAFQSIGTNAGGYSIGIGNSATDFASVTMTGATTATCAFGTANDANTRSITGPFDIYFTPDNTPPTISNETIANIAGTGNRTLTKTIGDGYNGKGIPTSGSYIPRIYYKKSTDATYVSTPGQYVSSGTQTNTVWDFTVDHSLLGGVVAGDVIQYFVIAQDNNFNISSNPTGAVATDVNTITTYPTSPSSYFIPSNFSGVVTVGTGGDYESLSNAGGLFEQISAGTVLGDVTVNIISDLPGETGTISLSAWAEDAGGPYTVTIKPNGGARTITTTNALKLNGTTGVTIDGLNDGTNSLSILKPASSGGILVLQNGASDNTITNTYLSAYGYTSSSYYVISIYNSSAAVNSNNTISNNTITTSSSPTRGIYAGIMFTGTSSRADGTVIDNNKLIDIYQYAIWINNNTAVNTVVSNNEIYNTAAVSSNRYFNGIYVYGNIGTTNVFNNYIHDILFSSTNSTFYAATGIYSNPSGGSVLNVYNNVVALDETTLHEANAYKAISVYGYGTTNISYNSIYVGGSAVTDSYGSYGIYVLSTAAMPAPIIKNNAIFMARSNSTGTGKHYGIYTASTVTSDYNDIFANGTGG